MPARSKIDLLPKDVRAQLDAKIITQSFAGYRDLADWLTENGYHIAKDAVHRHGQNLERKLEAVKRATEQAKAIVEASPDDEGAMNDALIRLVQQIDFDILCERDELGIDKIDYKSLAAMTRSVASLARAQVQQKRWMLEAREKLKAKVSAVDAQVAEVVKSGGLSDADAARSRNALLDINV